MRQPFVLCRHRGSDVFLLDGGQGEDNITVAVLLSTASYSRHPFRVGVIQARKNSGTPRRPRQGGACRRLTEETRLGLFVLRVGKDATLLQVCELAKLVSRGRRGGDASYVLAHLRLMALCLLHRPLV